MKPYHHGDLKNTLIEAGIAYINKNGIGDFSLRKVAAACHVSHAAPYNHFKDKEALLTAMREYVSEKFTGVLQTALQVHQESPEIMVHLGRVYISFFAENPQYFQFIFLHARQTTIEASASAVFSSNFPPFDLFKNTAIQHMSSLKIHPSMFTDNIIAMWAIVQGLAYLYTLEGFAYYGNSEEFIERILREKMQLR